MTADREALVAEVAGMLAEHESLLGSDDYRECVCGVETANLGGLRAHVADALADLLAAREQQVRAEALRVEADLIGRGTCCPECDGVADMMRDHADQIEAEA